MDVHRRDLLGGGRKGGRVGAQDPVPSGERSRCLSASLSRCLAVSLSLFFDCPLSSSALTKFAECDGTLSQELMDHVRGVADVISARAPLAVRAAKRAMVQGEPTACVRYTRAVLPRLGGIR